MYTMPLEAETRVIIDRTLENLGWIVGNRRDKNVFLEQPKTEAEKKKLEGKKPDYVLYPKNGDSPLIVIETKKKGTPLDMALAQGIDYAKRLDAPLVFATDGVFCRSFHIIGNTTPKLNGEDVDEFMREALAIRFLTDWEVDTISQKVKYSRQELIKIFDEANNMLRGDGLRAGIERFGEFANILFLKLISEGEYIKKESGIKSSFDVDSCGWDAIKNIPAATRIEYINTTVYKKINSLYDTEIFTALTMRDADILKEIMNKLDSLTLTDVDSDVKGDAFEYFLRASASTKNDLGEYFTPRHIVKTMVRLVNPQIGEKIYDPFCGTGGFLIETFRHIYNNMARNKENEARLRANTVFGNEITNTARITKMNMILAGDGHSNINTIDSLANPVDGKYDIVITNMPYSQKTKHGSLYDVPSNNGDSICVQHCINAVDYTSENGRIALVVPEGFLFRKDLTKAREYLLERCQLQSIISLPQGVFLPYTGVKTNILYATKVNQKLKSTEKRKDFWYFDVKNDGYTLDNHRRKIDKQSDIAKFEEFRKLDDEQAEEMMKVGFDIIPLDKVRNNSNILVGSRYRDISVQVTSSFPVVNLGDKRYFTIVSGGTPSSANPDYWGKGISWITLADLPDGNFVNKIHDSERTITQAGLENSSAKLLPANTVIVSSRATIGRVGISEKELSTNQGFKNIVINDFSLVSPEYLAYILTGIKEKMNDMASGATFKELSKESFESIQVPLPTLEIQQQIVDELNAYQRIIGNAKDIAEYYSPTISYRFDWPKVKLGDVCEFAGGTQPPKNTFKFEGGEGYIRLLQIRDYKNDDYETYIPISERHKTCNADDVMIGRYGPPVFQILRGKSGAYNVALIKCIPNEDKLTKDWLFYFLSSIPIQNHITGLSIRGRQAGVNLDDLRNLDLPMPSIELQKQIIAELEKEQAIVSSSKQLIDVFNKKINNKINEIWGN